LRRGMKVEAVWSYETDAGITRMETNFNT